MGDDIFYSYRFEEKVHNNFYPYLFKVSEEYKDEKNVEIICNALQDDVYNRLLDDFHNNFGKDYNKEFHEYIMYEFSTAFIDDSSEAFEDAMERFILNN